MRPISKARIVSLGFSIAVLSLVTLAVNEKTAIVLLGMSLGTIIFGGLLKNLGKERFPISNRKRAEKQKENN